MSDLKLSGYYATAAALAWTSGQALDSAVNNEWTDLADELDNSSEKALFEDLEIVLASAAFTGIGSAIKVYLVPSLDGTNYPNWTGNVSTEEPENEQYYVGEVATSQATAAQRMVLRDVPLPNGKYRYAFRNASGVTLAGSSNSVNRRRHGYANT